MSFTDIEKLLVLEASVETIDSTGFTNIKENSNIWFCRLDEYSKNKNLTPIERVMNIILISVDQKLSSFYSFNEKPFLFIYPQTEISKYRADFVVCFAEKYIHKKYIIECDGHKFHEKTKEKAKNDKQRERFFVKNGYNVLRYSGSEIYNDFQKIKDELFHIFKKDAEEAENE
jgi:very-short-patch-repair endonuclease